MVLARSLHQALIGSNDNVQALKHVPQKLRDDEEIVLAAVAQQGNALQFASRRLRSDPFFVLKAPKTHMRKRVLACRVNNGPSDMTKLERIDAVSALDNVKKIEEMIKADNELVDEKVS